MSDLIAELKEDLQKEKLNHLWSRFGNYVVGAAIVIVFATAGGVWWNSFQSQKNASVGDAIYKALQTEKNGQTEEALRVYSEIISKHGENKSYIAAMRKATLLAEGGKKDEAAVIYKELAKNGSIPAEISSLAGILYLQDADLQNDKEALSMLTSFAEKNAVFKYTAKEMLGFYNYKSGKADEAAKIFEELVKDVYVPASIRERAVEMSNIIKTSKADK